MNFLKRLFGGNIKPTEPSTPGFHTSQAEMEAQRLKREAEKAEVAEANGRREANARGEANARRERKRAERVEAERLEAEAVTKGELLPRLCETNVAGKEIGGTFRAAGQTWQAEPAPYPMILGDAENYATRLTLGGVEWRLPTVYELKAMYLATRSSSALAAYPGMNEGWYWSASRHPKGKTFCVNFENGSVAGNVNDKPIGVRCVIRETSASETSSAVTKETAERQAPNMATAEKHTEGTFSAAGLTWQREPARWKMNWEDAKSYAARLTLAGGGWRLPTVSELEALHEEKLSSSLTAAHPGMGQGWYWSVSPGEDPFYIWGVDFGPKHSGSGPWDSSYGGGMVTGYGTTSVEAVRCVRHPTEQDKIKEKAAREAEAKAAAAKAAIKEAKSPFFNAIRNGDLGTVERLLNDMPDLLLSKDEHDNWPLHFAAEGGHKAIVELVLHKKKCDVNVKARNGNKPLHLAAEGGHKDVAELLLNKKADVNAMTNKGYTPLHLATEGGHKAVVELLLLKKAVVNAVTNKGLTPLRLAVLAGKQDLVELLRLHGGRE